jgi:WD40 repeat protein
MSSLILLAIPMIAAAQASPLDKLDAQKIPADRRFAGQPKELVAVFGDPVEVNPDGHIHFYATFTPDNRTLATVVHSKVQFWDMTGAEAKKGAGFKGGTGWVVAFSPDGKTMAMSGVEVALWDVSAEPKVKLKLRTHEKSALSVTYSPDGKTLAVGNYDGTVQLWDLTTPEPRERAELKGHTAYATGIGFTPDGKRLASGSFDQSLLLWDLTPNPPQRLATLQGESVRSGWMTLFSADGKTFTTSGGHPQLYLWDVNGSELKVRTKLEGHSAYVMSAAYVLGGKALVSQEENGQIFLWNVATGKKLHEWKLPGTYHLVTTTKDGRYLAALNKNGLVYILRLGTFSEYSGK